MTTQQAITARRCPGYVRRAAGNLYSYDVTIGDSWYRVINDGVPQRGAAYLVVARRYSRDTCLRRISDTQRNARTLATIRAAIAALPQPTND